MPKKKRRSSTITRYTILFAILLLAANILLGVVMTIQSASTIQTLIRQNMLNISNTASALIDGDELKVLTESDVDSDVYRKILQELRAFQENVDIEYIYAVKQTGEDTFVFTVDADPVNPAEFGKEVLVTNALRMAAKGTATVDDEPAEDEWGDFYSAYSPVKDSDGNIVGIVGVDFNSEWYTRQIREHTMSIALVSALAVLIGALAILYVTNRVRRQFVSLNDELSVLSDDMDELSGELLSDPIYRDSLMQNADHEPDESSDVSTAGAFPEIDELGRKMHEMHTEFLKYLDYVHGKAYTDALTHIGNTTAYIETYKRLDEKIAEDSAVFSIAVFDINYLKKVNDEYGHLCGDRIIKGAAIVMSKIFGRKNCFRIGGDEFIVILENVTEQEMKNKLAVMEKAIDDYNRQHADEPGQLSVSMGCAQFDPERDSSFRKLFSRADEEMYGIKNAYHEMNWN